MWQLELFAELLLRQSPGLTGGGDAVARELPGELLGVNPFLVRILEFGHQLLNVGQVTKPIELVNRYQNVSLAIILTDIGIIRIGFILATAPYDLGPPPWPPAFRILLGSDNRHSITLIRFCVGKNAKIAIFSTPRPNGK